MNTTAAATQAGVTVATIRAWCRRGVVAAAKRAGRWVIDAASLAYRISLTKKDDMIDLTATYTWTDPGCGAKTTTVKVADRTRRTGRVISVRGLAPLLAEQIDAIADEGDRVHTLIVLEGAVIALREDGSDRAGRPGTAMDGRVHTSYVGTRHLPLETVLALGERLHAQLMGA